MLYSALTKSRLLIVSLLCTEHRRTTRIALTCRCVVTKSIALSRVSQLCLCVCVLVCLSCSALHSWLLLPHRFMDAFLPRLIDFSLSGQIYLPLAQCVRCARAVSELSPNIHTAAFLTAKHLTFASSFCVVFCFPFLTFSFCSFFSFRSFIILSCISLLHSNELSRSTVCVCVAAFPGHWLALYRQSV